MAGGADSLREVSGVREGGLGAGRIVSPWRQPWQDRGAHDDMATPIELCEALQEVLEVPCSRTDRESVILPQAVGRRLFQTIATDGPWPATDRSAMDGFAVRAGAGGLVAGSSLPVAGESLAGHPFAGEVREGAAIRIMTGAVVPPGVDAVVPVEDTSGYEGAVVTLHKAVQSGQNIRPAGSEAAKGQPVMCAGQPVRAAEVGALAVLGHAEVEVFRRVRVGVVATGDEVVPVDCVPAAHQVRESNSWALLAQIAECGGEGVRLGTAPDEPVALREMLAHGLETCDVLLTIGGISKGTHDLVHGTLAELGIEQVFHGIRLKPGKPTFFGRRGADRFVYGLPGNPASCFTVFDLLVRPLLERLMGGEHDYWRIEAEVGGAPFRRNQRLQAIPCRLMPQGGGLVAELSRAQPSGNPFCLLGSDGYALIPPGAEPGGLDRVTVLGYSQGMLLR